MNRREIIKALSILPLSYGAMKLSALHRMTSDFSSSKRLPVLFIGHGHPMNAILDNDFTRNLARLGQSLERPNAILVISAHWETNGTYVSTNPWPKTIYDFGRFDDRLMQVQYEPQGHPELAKELMQEVQLTAVKEDPNMGLDHGAWTVLKFIFPQADIPVFQMSMDYTRTPAFHFQLGQELIKLREKGVLIICSGNIVHNLRALDWGDIDAEPYDWNVEFDLLVKKFMKERRFQQLVDYTSLGALARLAIPTNDHYLPMIYSLGLTDLNEPIHHIYEGYQYAGISMRCFKVG